MNIYDIASKANVSIATVSRVLNNKGSVSEKTRQRVLSVMDENNYTPNMFARSLGLNTMKMVGVLCSDISDIFYARSISVIEKRLRAEGFDMILCCTGVNITDKKKYMELLLQKRVDAMILIGSIFKEQNDNSHIEEAARRVPLVIINSYLDLPNTYCVYCDEENAAYEAVSLMIKSGRKRIGYVCGPQTPNALLKEAGFRRALADNNLPAIPELIVHGRPTLEDAYAYVNQLVIDKVGFDAFFMAEDIIAVGAIKALRHHKIKIPDDVCLIGFNNSIYSQCCSPTITTVDNLIETCSTTAVNILLDLFEGKQAPTRVALNSNLVVRETFLV